MNINTVALVLFCVSAGAVFLMLAVLTVVCIASEISEYKDRKNKVSREK